MRIWTRCLRKSWCCVKSLRLSRKSSKTLKDERGIQINTLKNYTRWPLAIMRDLRWTEKDREGYRRSDKTFELHRLTPLGKERAQSLEHSVDLRVDQLDQLPFDQKRALSRHAHFAMMERAGFDLTSVADQLRQEEGTLREALRALGVAQDRPLLFSPFQSFSITDSIAIFPTPAMARVGRSDDAVLDGADVGRGSRDHLFVAPTFVASNAEAEGSELDDLKAELRAIRGARSTLDTAARAFARKAAAPIPRHNSTLWWHIFCNCWDSRATTRGLG